MIRTSAEILAAAFTDPPREDNSRLLVFSVNQILPSNTVNSFRNLTSGSTTTFSGLGEPANAFSESSLRFKPVLTLAAYSSVSAPEPEVQDFSLELEMMDSEDETMFEYFYFISPQQIY
jgi:hypothetical protein